MIDFKVDADLCIQCEECVKDCPRMIIKMGNGLPVADPEREANCFGCQHCLTVCPTGAISLHGLDPADSIPLKGNWPAPEQMETLIKGRRSCRAYRQEGLGRETIDKLLNIMASAPTGVNTMQTLFTVVDDPAVMDSIRGDPYAAIQKMVEAGTLPEHFAFFESYLAPWLKKGADSLYRGAPHMLVTSCPTNGPSTPADGYIALSYFELMANAMGLGTLWCGLAKWMLHDLAPELGARLNIPDDHTFVYAMLFGKPARRFYRTIQKGPAKINRVK